MSGRPSLSLWLQVAGAAALAMAPAAASARDGAPAYIPFCAGGERKVMVIQIGDGSPAEPMDRHTACHAARLADRKTAPGARR